MTSFGKTTCRDGYEDVYVGYAMTSWAGSQVSPPSAMICAKDKDGKSRAVTSIPGSGSPQLTFVRDEDTGSKIVQCVVCRKAGNRPVIHGQSKNSGFANWS